MEFKNISTSGEIWRVVPNFLDYFVSNKGRVLSTKHNKEKILRPSENGGYLSVLLCNEKTKRKFLVHRLVMLAFVGESELTVDHIDSNKSNNKLENLEYVTQEENNNRYKTKREIEMYGKTIEEAARDFCEYLKEIHGL